MRLPLVGAVLGAMFGLAPAVARAGTIVTGLGAGGTPQVSVFDAGTAALQYSFLGYDVGFAGGVRVAVGDVNGDDTADIVTGTGPGGGPHVKVFDGSTGAEIRSFFAFDPGFTGGIYVAAGDLNGDGAAEIVVGADAGGAPQVKVFDGATNAVIRSFLAYDVSFAGGVHVAAGDVNGDGTADIVTGTGPGGGPHVKVFDGSTGAEIQSFFAAAPTFTGGIYVAAGASLPTLDKTPPVLSLPPDVSVDATGPDGATVSYTATATDAVDGAVPVTCSPPSGSTFPIGDTTVECTASDAAGNVASGSFVVHVSGAGGQLGDLLALVVDVGPGSALADKIELAQSYLAAGNIPAACSTLDGFIALAQAQSGKKLTAGQATTLIASAEQLESVLGC